MKKSKVQETSLLAMFIAIIVAMTFIPYVGYISIPGGLSITTLHIPVIVAVVLLKKYWTGLVIGTAWGLTCWINALLNATADAVIFYNPLISVLPRAIAGVLIIAFYKLAVYLCSKNKLCISLLSSIIQFAVAIFMLLLGKNVSDNIWIGIAVAAIAYFITTAIMIYYSEKLIDKAITPALFACIMGTLSHTALVLTAMSVFGSGVIAIEGLIQSILSTVIALNGTVEITAAIFVAVPCILALNKATTKNKI